MSIIRNRLRSQAQHSWSELVNELHPRHLALNLTIGIVLGLIEIIVAISFAAIIFSGDLSRFFVHGIGLALLGTAISGTVVALLSSRAGTVGGNQDTPAAIMATISAGIAAVLLASGASESEVLATVLVAIALTSLLTGIVLFVLGYFELGSLVRFLPYPVIGGFLAGTGWLLVTGSIGLMTDLSLDLPNLGGLIEIDLLARWLPGLLLAVVLLFLSGRSDNVFILPGVIIGSIALFYLLVWISGASLGEIRSMGWLFGPFPGENLWQPPPWGELKWVNWQAIALQLPNIGSIVLLTAVAALLNATSLEVASGQNIAPNRELRAAGVSTLLAGLAGGLVGYQQVSMSTLRIKQGEGGRLVGLIAAVLCLVVLLAGSTFLSYFPKLVTGGVLLYLGLAFLKEWVYDSWFRLPRIEYAIVIFILLVIAAVGFLAGVAVGVVSAIILFAVAYSRIDVVRMELSGETVSSRVSRSPRARQYLQQEGGQLYILKLEGFIFFGTSDKFLSRVRARLESAEGVQIQFLLIDFQRVTGLDSTAMRSLTRLRELTSDRDLILLITGSSPVVRLQLQNGGLAADDTVHFFKDLDHGVTWCEDELLKQANLSRLETPPTLVQQLTDLLPHAADFRPIMAYLERREVAAGDYLIKQGEAPGSLYFIESGQVTAQLELPGQAPLRLQAMGSGHVVGEIGFYLEQPRTASVVADIPGVIYCLHKEELARMEKEAPQTASALHRLIIHLVSERVSHLTRTVDALER